MAWVSTVKLQTSRHLHCMDAGGHAAHMANIDQHSPFFSQERAPMSVRACTPSIPGKISLGTWSVSPMQTEQDVIIHTFLHVHSEHQQGVL